MTTGSESATEKEPAARLSELIQSAVGLIVMLVIVYSGLAMPAMVEKSDYLMAFYTAGKLVASGQAPLLYPEPGAQSFLGSAFDRAAHAYLPHLPEKAAAAYMYMPLDAWLFAPFASLPPAPSLIAWQALTLAALFLSLRMLGGGRRRRTVSALLSSLSFAPVAMTVWIGQLGILLGVLPAALGLWLLRRGRPFAAGLAWSLIALKPQFLILPATLAMTLAAAGRARPLLGFAAGIAAVVAANLIVATPEVFQSWLVCLETSERVFADPTKAGLAVPGHLITSLPNALLLLVPTAQQALAKLVVYSVAFAVLIAGLAKCYRLVKSDTESRLGLNLAVLVALAMLPLVMPHFLIYDLCILIVGLPIVDSFAAGDSLHRRLKRIMTLSVVATNVYTLCFLLRVPVPPLILPACLLVAFIGLLRAAPGQAETAPEARSANENPAEELL